MDELNTAPVPFYEEYFTDTYFRHYADFKGRASRSKFWLSYIALYVVSLGVTGLALLLAAAGTAGMMVGIAIAVIFSIALIIPGLALTVRRLRDAGSNPWMILIALIPLIGSIILLVLLCKATKFTDPVTGTVDTAPHNKPTTFGVSGFIVTAVCVALLIIGCVVPKAGFNPYDEVEWDFADRSIDYADTCGVVEVWAEDEAVVAESEYDEGGLDSFLERSDGTIYFCRFEDNQEFFLSINLEIGDGLFLTPDMKIIPLQLLSDDAGDRSAHIICVQNACGNYPNITFDFEQTYGWMGERHYNRPTVKGVMKTGGHTYAFKGHERYSDEIH